MTNREREILRMASKNISQRSMASALSCSRHYVAKVLARAKELNLSWPLPTDMNDAMLVERLFAKDSGKSVRHLPDYARIDREMRKSGVTLTILWTEYCEDCRAQGNIPFMFTQFCHYYRQYRLQQKATMHLERHPGEQIEVDWAGKTATVRDPDTGKDLLAYLFVATLSYSQYTYVEAFYKRDLASWINAHVRLFQFLGGVPKVIVPDNLKTGVTKADWYHPQIQRNYQELAEHYDTVILPARPVTPKDKPNVEGNVGNIMTGILAKIRHIPCFSLDELNQLLWEKLETFNARPFQKKDGSRASWFQEEKESLLPLPRAPYQLASWKEATVQFNYHISLDRMHYSVPCEYIKQKVQVKYTSRTVEIFSKDLRIASHLRLYGAKGQYSTVLSHMPPEHQAYLEWDAPRFLNWALAIGPSTHAVVKGILDRAKVKQQAFKSCMGLLKLADRYSKQLLEQAAVTALEFSQRPSYKTVHKVLLAHLEHQGDHVTERQETTTHAFTRGATYYGEER